jgi:hypothetical protein
MLSTTKSYRASMTRKATSGGLSALHDALHEATSSEEEEEEGAGGGGGVVVKKDKVKHIGETTTGVTNGSTMVGDYNASHQTFTLPYRFGFTPSSLYEVVEKLDESTIVPPWVVKLSDKRHHSFLGNRNNSAAGAATTTTAYEKLAMANHAVKQQMGKNSASDSPSIYGNIHMRNEEGKEGGEEGEEKHHSASGLVKFTLEIQSIPSWIEVSPLEGYLPLGGEVELLVKVQPITEAAYNEHSIGKNMRAVVVVRIFDKIVPLPLW